MFLEQRSENNQYRCKSRWGTPCIRNRKRTIFLLQCDCCSVKFERLKSNIDKNRLNKKHICPDCYSASLLQGFSNEVKKGNRRNLVGECKIDSCGYVSIYVQDTYKSPRVRGGSIREHIMVMENHLSRALQKGEVVHHIDGNKTNNNLDNLDLMTVAEHNACHGKTELIVFDLYKRGIVAYDRENKRYYIKEENAKLLAR